MHPHSTPHHECIIQISQNTRKFKNAKKAMIECTQMKLKTDTTFMCDIYDWKIEKFKKQYVSSNYGCRSLGQSSTSFRTNKKNYPIYLSDLNCTGSESNIGMCRGYYDVYNCSTDFVGIDCSGKTCFKIQELKWTLLCMQFDADWILKVFKITICHFAFEKKITCQVYHVYDLLV